MPDYILWAALLTGLWNFGLLVFLIIGFRRLADSVNELAETARKSMELCLAYEEQEPEKPENGEKTDSVKFEEGITNILNYSMDKLMQGAKQHGNN